MSESDAEVFEVPLAFYGEQSGDLAQLVAQAIHLCQGDMPRLFELTIASPTLVMSLFMTTRFIIDNSFGVPEPERIKTLRNIKNDTADTLRKILLVIESEDPAATMKAQLAEMKANAAFAAASTTDVH